MASLIGGPTIVVGSSGGDLDRSDTHFRNYLEGLNGSGPASMWTVVNCPKTNVPNGGTTSVLGTASPEPIYAYRYAVDYPCTLKTLSINVTVAASANWRAGVYRGFELAGDILPGTLLSDSGNGTTNPASLRTVTLNTPLAVGLYWFGLALQASAGSTLSTYDNTRAETLGMTAVNTAILGLSRTFTYGALPATWGATFTQETNPMPALYATFGA